MEPSPPFVVMIPLVLEGGLTLSSVLVGMIESRGDCDLVLLSELSAFSPRGIGDAEVTGGNVNVPVIDEGECCLLYTSPSPRDATLSRMPSSA